MIRLTDEEIEAIATRIARNAPDAPVPHRPAGTPSRRTVEAAPGAIANGIFSSITEAVHAATTAQIAWSNLTLDRRWKIFAELR